MASTSEGPPDRSGKGDYPRYNFQPKGHVIENLAKDRLRAFTSGGQFSYSLHYFPRLTFQRRQSATVDV